MANRLAGETSPYLLQHKDNPVDWRPWGEAAFAEARRRDVPVFLSVGYSTCYWCHVMEREVFENEHIAGQMNERFVNVKVDREERPDVDEHYMTATQVLAGQGGWPMSVFLTPAGEPFFAGTYFPPRDTGGRPGFPSVLQSLSDAWRDNREELDGTVGQMRGILAKLAKPPAPEHDLTFDDDLLVSLVNRSMSDYDAPRGGFGGAPKFPRETLLETLLCAQHYYALDNAGWSPALRRTLDAMADGGLRDHLGGGFHRYSTDARWLVPHFEIMLYDQAMLAWVYVEAYKQFEEPRYGRVARGILDFVLRDMTDAGGAFYTALDAEVDGHEGQNYLWTPREVVEVLGPRDGATFNAIYGLDKGFNFADPHGPSPHMPDRNVLFLAEPKRENARGVADLRRRLLEARGRRKGPRLDDKILTSWNGLMIRAFAHAANVFQDTRYQSAAENAANWLLRRHRNPHGGLLRSSRDGRSNGVDGFLDDYANLARGLFALWEAGGNEVYLDHAGELAAYLQTRFGDEAGGYFFADAGGGGGDELGAMSGVRRKVGTDNPLPSGNASAALLMLELDKLKACRGVLEAFAGQLADHPEGMSAMLEAAIRYKGRVGAFKVAGEAMRRKVRPTASVEHESAEAVEVAKAEWATPRRLDLTLHIARGFHLYAEESETARPVEIACKSSAFHHAEPPASRDGRLTGDVTFRLHFSRPSSDVATEVAVRYQACDAARCMLPMRKLVEVRPRR